MAEIEVRVRQNGKPYLRVRLKQSPATIGRDPDADVYLDSTAVSRLHARLFFDGNGVRIVDAGSTNGIRVDGVQHAKTELAPSQTVTICEFALRARAIADAQPLGDELSEGWLEMDELDDDTSVGAADTNVRKLVQQPTDAEDEPRSPEPSVLLRDDDVDVDDTFDQDEADDEEHTPVPAIDEQADTAADNAPADTTHDPNEGDLSASALAASDEDDEADAERVPEHVPAMLTVMRHAASELEGAPLTAIEVLVSVGSRLHDVALVRPGGQYWWGRQPTFPASLWTVPNLDHFPLVVHRESGTYDVQVPQDSPWKMFHRGQGKAVTYRTGKLVGMRVAVGEHAEVTFGPYAIYLRCVQAPPALITLFDLRHYLPSPAALAAFAIALLLNFIVIALPAEPHRFFQTSAPPEHFVAFDNGEKPPPPPPPELPVLELAEVPKPEAAPPAAEPFPQKQAAPGIAGHTRDKNRPPLPVKPQNTPPDPNAGVTTIEAAPTPQKQMSIGDFRVAGMLQGVPEPMIQKNRGPALSGGPALLRGEKSGSTAVMGKDGTGATIIPPGRIETIDLQRTINTHQREAMQCYTQVGLRDNPESAGKLELQWTVDESGQAKRVRVVVDELRSAPMTKCMREAIERWTFPVPTGGPAVVSYPFRFTNPNL